MHATGLRFLNNIDLSSLNPIEDRTEEDTSFLSVLSKLNAVYGRELLCPRYYVMGLYDFTAWAMKLVEKYGVEEGKLAFSLIEERLVSNELRDYSSLVVANSYHEFSSYDQNKILSEPELYLLSWRHLLYYIEGSETGNGSSSTYQTSPAGALMLHFGWAWAAAAHEHFFHNVLPVLEQELKDRPSGSSSFLPERNFIAFRAVVELLDWLGLKWFGYKDDEDLCLKIECALETKDEDVLKHRISLRMPLLQSLAIGCGFSSCKITPEMAYKEIVLHTWRAFQLETEARNKSKTFADQ